MPATAITFTVPCIPVAQPRQRHRIAGSGPKAFVQNYTPAKSPVNEFKATCRMAARQAYSGPPIEGAMEVEIVAVFPRLKGHFWKKRPMPRLRKTSKPDIDNVAKSLFDALTGVVWRDDAQIADLRCMKREAAADEQPHVTVTIACVPDEVAVSKTLMEVFTGEV